MTVPSWATASTKPSYTATEVGVPAWATASTKPTYTANEVGALPTGTTLDNVGDGSTRKLSDYATSASVNTLSSATHSHVTNTGIHVPAHSASDSGKVLSVDSSGNLVWITPVSVYTGSGAPNPDLGTDGDIYLQTS